MLISNVFLSDSMMVFFWYYCFSEINHSTFFVIDILLLESSGRKPSGTALISKIFNYDC